MMLDSQVAACISILKASIIEEGITITSAIADDKADGYELAGQIADKARAMIDGMDTSLDETLWDMLNYMAYGNKVGELVYVIEDNQLNLKKIKVKPSHSVAFVVDEHLNIIGLLGDVDGMGVRTGLPDPKDVLPAEKFLIMSHRQENSDPRGTSVLRPAYDAWWRKKQLMPEYLKYLTQFAGPSLIGYTSEGAILEEPEDEDDEVESYSSPQEAMTAALLNLQNGSVASFAFGSKVEPLNPEGDGTAFLNAFDQFNLEITKSILTQQLATEEGEHQAKAAARVHQDVLDTLIRQGKRAVARAIGVQILRRWVNYNWGPTKLALTPRATLGMIEYRDIAVVMQAVAGLVRAGYFVDEQLAATDKIMGFPIRTAEQMAAQFKKQKELLTAGKPAPSAAPRSPQQDEDDGPRDQSDQENGGRQPRKPEQG
jgi:hypothetical protein